MNIKQVRLQKNTKIREEFSQNQNVKQPNVDFKKQGTKK